MSEDSQIEIPQSFIARFIEPGRSKPSASRFFIAQRYELCEDMAQLLTQTAQQMLHTLGIAEEDVLQRCRQGLLAAPAPFQAVEAEWVVCRLAELCGWPLPQPPRAIRP